MASAVAQPARRRPTALALLLLPTLVHASGLEPASPQAPATGRLTFYALRHGQSRANVAGVISSEPGVALGAAHGLTAAGLEQAESAARDVVALARESGCGVAIYTSDFSRAWQTACCAYSAVAAAGIPVWPVTGGPQREVSLRERWFGDLDGGPDREYPSVWVCDAQDAAHTRYGIESVDAVRARVLNLVRRIHAELENEGGSGSAGAESGHGSVRGAGANAGGGSGEGGGKGGGGGGSGGSGGGGGGSGGGDVGGGGGGGSSPRRWIVLLVAHGDVLQIGQTLFAGMPGCRHRELPHLPTATLRRLGEDVAQ